MKKVNRLSKSCMKNLKNGNSNTNNILDWFEEEEIIQYITWVMAYDFEITDVEKAVEDIIHTYNKEKIVQQRNDIIKKLEDKTLTKEEIVNLEKSLNETIIKLAKMK